MRRALSGILTIVAVCLAAQAGGGYKFLVLQDHDVKWGIPAAGHGAVLTYAVGGGASGSINCRKTTGLHGLLAHSALSRTQFNHELDQAFAMWADAANVRFTPAASPAAADVVIAAEAVPDGIAYSDVTPADTGGGNFRAIKSGIICLNPAETWTATAGGPAKSYRLRYVLAHELGHVLGLDHPSPRGELMSFDYNPKIETLQPGDVRGIVALYGPRRSTVAQNAVTQGQPSFALK